MRWLLVTSLLLILASCDKPVHEARTPLDPGALNVSTR